MTEERNDGTTFRFTMVFPTDAAGFARFRDAAKEGAGGDDLLIVEDTSRLPSVLDSVRDLTAEEIGAALTEKTEGVLFIPVMLLPGPDPNPNRHLRALVGKTAFELRMGAEFMGEAWANFAGKLALRFAVDLFDIPLEEIKEQLRKLDKPFPDLADLPAEEIKEQLRKLTKPFTDLADLPWEEIRKRFLAAVEVTPQRTKATFPVAAGFNPVHRLATRTAAGRLPYPELSEQFHELRTPLTWAVGLALFASTSEQNPRDWQEVTLADLVGKVYALTERGAPRRGDHREDILAEVVKLHTERNALVRYDWEKRGRYWTRRVNLRSEYAIPSLELVFIDRKGRRVAPSEAALRSLTVPLEVKGRRAFKPDGSAIDALPKGNFRLETIRWRWNPSFADDLQAAVALDGKGKVKRSAGGHGQPAIGKPLRAGFNIRVAKSIFEALAVLRAEGATIAHDLLVLLALDIAPQKTAEPAGRNAVEKEAGRLFDLLGLAEDRRHPRRRLESVAAAIFRLKQSDIGALLPGSTELPIQSTNPNRRKADFYRLIRSPEFTPRAALVSKCEAAALRIEAAAEQIPAAPDTPKLDQLALPGMDPPPGPPIPSGSDIRAAREAAKVNLRDFAGMMKGPAFKTWSNYETGKMIRTDTIKRAVWKRVQAFVDQHKPKDGEG